MPPRVKTTKEDIVEASLALVRAGGDRVLNARSIAAALGCSTQPIFSNFSGMEELERETIAAAYAHYLEFLSRETESGAYPPYKAFGMAYIRFAREERELFKLLFMRNRTGEDLSPSPDYEESARMIASANGVSMETARLIHLEVWACVHGIATMLVTSFLPLEEELISTMLSDVYLGIRERYREKEETK